MKAFAKRGYRLRDAKLEVRLIYTGFLIFIALGMLTIAAFQLRHIGPGPSDIAAYYRGGERAGEMTFPASDPIAVDVAYERRERIKEARTKLRNKRARKQRL